MNIVSVENELLGDASVYDSYGKYVENTFQRMKQLASQAGWPTSLTPQIVAIDKEWQRTKEVANARKLSLRDTASPVLADMWAMISRLEAFIKNRSQTPAQAAASTQTSLSTVPSSSGDASTSSDAVPSDTAPPGDWLNVFKRQYGPLPLWGWGALGVAVVVAVGYWRKSST